MSPATPPPSRSNTPSPPSSRSSTPSPPSSRSSTPSPSPSRSSTPPPPDSPSRSSTPPPPVPDEYEQQIPRISIPSPPYAAHNALLATPDDSSKRPYTLPTLHSGTTIISFLTEEFSVNRINTIVRHLWLVGPFIPERPLHRQLIAGREIIVAEKIDLHLCWEGKQLYLKPIPAFLLHHDFFEEYICTAPSEDARSDLYASACGFLKSYTKLIRHESDLEIAKDKKLIPSSVTWEQWCAFSADIEASTSVMILSQRYDYGELRLTRLNLLYEMCVHEPFHLGDNRYKFLFDTISFEWLLFAFVYFTVVLTAMQAVLATEYGAGSAGVQRVSFGFGVFVLAMAGVSWAVMGGFMVLRVYVFFFSETWIGRQQYRIYYVDRIMEGLFRWGN
ncbi:uncharacterized protein H6S33_010012 [Morchella sextelata]|uniref:uncharacterized protein n=1 Tax=Morchella sextelata TaxID=1174677 RepID=UPI001D05608D|nr:uncharacterized protein H6S33_010012 [Morchella sextelata]KAH0611960.1 hypothetical protein H6S33_010012 [Morchella sextelata]